MGKETSMLSAANSRLPPNVLIKHDRFGLIASIVLGNGSGGFVRNAVIERR
ncbi:MULTISPECIES: hypothetical protein [Ruegeria]|uniref:hypothetical protein n=1 Tax=Ruegeria TaxID=97050 RepID=UPI0014814C32|nr:MULTISPECIES: hypothetical protein [Ruegeria]UWR08430.1 hypothetical protein K3752_05555 [Ruegeria sp. B32]